MIRKEYMNDASNSYSFGQTQSLLNGESGKMSELFRIIQAYVESTPEKIVFFIAGGWKECYLAGAGHGLGKGLPLVVLHRRKKEFVIR